MSEKPLHPPSYSHQVLRFLQEVEDWVEEYELLKGSGIAEVSEDYGVNLQELELACKELEDSGYNLTRLLMIGTYWYILTDRIIYSDYKCPWHQAPLLEWSKGLFYCFECGNREPYTEAEL